MFENAMLKWASWEKHYNDKKKALEKCGISAI